MRNNYKGAKVRAPHSKNSRNPTSAFNHHSQFSPISEDVGCIDFAGRLQMALTILILFNCNDSIELKNIEIYAPIFFKHNILSKTGVKGSSYIFINKRDYTSHKRPMIND